MRAYFKLLFVFIWVILCFSFRVPGFFCRPFSIGLDHWFRHKAFVWASRGICSIVGMRIRIVGTPPEAPFFLVSNHLSFLDVFLLASQLGCIFVSKNDLATMPFFGFITRNMNTIYIDREDFRDTARVNAEIKEAMEEGMGVAIFPESKVSVDGTILPFKPALLQPAVELDLPVHHAFIHYSTPTGQRPASEVAIWRDGVNLIQHFLNVAKLPWYEATLTFGEKAIENSDRKILAQELQRAVEKQYRPISQ
jgi:1-acyl-sn-glycerol-3-phosphate acyltransferase